jgi:hypothetical protein
MAEMGDDTQGLAKKTYPCEPAHTGRRGRLGVLTPATSEGTQALVQNPTPVSIPPAHTSQG